MSLINDIPETERPREKLINRGPASLSSAELLAIFLRTGTAGRSAIQIGQELIDRHGSLGALGSLKPKQLVEMKGLGLAKACQLSAAFELGSRLAREDMERQPVDNPENVYAFLRPQLAFLRHEVILVISVDNRLKVMASEQISQGTNSAAITTSAEVLRPVILNQAPNFILIHNHPSGNPSPSNADKTFTKQIIEAARLMEVNLLDHIIVGHPSKHRQPYYSFKENDLI